MADTLKIFLFSFVIVMSFDVMSITTKSLPVKELKEQINKKNKLISRLKNQISQAESIMRKRNDDHLKLTKEKKELELELYKLRNQFGQLDIEINSLQGQLHSLMARYLLEALPETQYAIEELAARKLLKEESVRQYKDVKVLRERLVALNLSIVEKEKTLDDYELREEELSNVIGKLELDKDDQTKSYLDETDTLMKLQKDFVKTSREREEEKRVSHIKQMSSTTIAQKGFYLSPIKNYQQIVANKKKGVSFYFKGIENIFAPADGVIDHQGQLSTFGNVIIIKHSGEERSVILGDISSKLKVGDEVKSGQFLGHAGSRTSDVSKLYYDVRVKNQVKDTYSLIDKSSLQEEKTLYQEQTVKL